jgi:parallel beta-helix repeat protein
MAQGYLVHAYHCLQGGRAMNHGARSIVLALLGGLAATAVAWLLLSGSKTRTANADDTPHMSSSGSAVWESGIFTYPLTITLDIRDTFGPRLLLPGEHSRYDYHRGVDWPALEGTPVRAVTTGTVRTFRGDWVSGTGSGNYVHLIHEDIGYETRYNHLSAVHPVITDGLHVVPGQIIGWVGDTGAAYAHLHFEVRQGMTVTQRAAIHPLSTPFLPWTNRVSPTVALLGVYTDATGLTALVEVTSPYTEPDVLTVTVGVDGVVADSRVVDYVGLNASTTVVADLDDPCVDDVCIVPADLNVANGYRVVMAFRGLGHGPTATVTARVFDVDGWGATDVATLTDGLEVSPVEQTAMGVPGETATFTYTLINRTGAEDTFTLTHLSAQGWPAVVTPATATLGHGASVTVTVVITLNTNRFGPSDCGWLMVEGGAQRVVAGFYRVDRHAHVSEVGHDGTGTGGMDAPFASIDHAVDQTDAGGSVRVAQGTYTENLTLSRTVHLLGGFAADWTTRTLAAYSTIIDGGGSDAVLVIDGDYGPVVEGFTLFNGHRHGGAGGGVRLVGGAAPALCSNWILSNTSDLGGGGIYVSSWGTLTPTIADNSVADNASGSYGGGIYVGGRSVLIQGNVISGNHAITDGGGIYLSGDTTAHVLGNHILGNRAEDDGGGVAFRSGSIYFVGNVVKYNSAGDDGGGVMIMSSGAYLANNVIRSNVAGDRGHGVWVAGSSTPRIYNNTLVANHPEGGVGLYVNPGSVPVVVNNIVASHTVGVYCGSQVTVSFSVLSNTTDLSGNCISVANIVADPLLYDEVHLSLDSPAIDAGDGAPPAPTIDFDGEPRPVDGNCDGNTVTDIGADEVDPLCLYLPAVLKNYTGLDAPVTGYRSRD